MTSSSHYVGSAQNPRAPCASDRGPVSTESGFGQDFPPSGLRARVQNGLYCLKDSLVAPLKTGGFTGISPTRKFAQFQRTARTNDRRLLPSKFVSDRPPQPSGLCARVQIELEELSSNLVALFGPSEATYHSIGWEGFLTPRESDAGYRFVSESSRNRRAGFVSPADPWRRHPGNHR
jgi:hypothetical protein